MLCCYSNTPGKFVDDGQDCGYWISVLASNFIHNHGHLDAAETTSEFQSYWHLDAIACLIDLDILGFLCDRVSDSVVRRVSTYRQTDRTTDRRV